MKVKTLIHTLVVRYGNPNMYIFMNTKNPSITVSRYILRTPPNIFTSDSNEDTNWIPSAATPIESGDVDGYDGPTWS
jgi:rhamnogalacturonan endolyase